MPTIAEVYCALAEVYDPELDTPITELGFINEVQIDGGQVTVTYTVPTFWCAPNFVFIMSQDIRREVGQIPGVHQVTVIVRNNCLADEINRGINTGLGFAETFPNDVDNQADLEALRQTFIVKGFLARQDVLIRRMRQVGLSDATILNLRIGDLVLSGEDLLIQTAPPQRIPLAAIDLQKYLHKRRQLHLAVAADARLFTTVTDQPIAEADLPAYLRYSRSVRLNIAFNTSLCEGLLRTQFFAEQQYDYSSVGDRLIVE